MSTRRRRLIQALLLLVLLGSWQLASNSVLSEFWISSPAAIARHAWTITANGELLYHLAYTLYTASIGYVLGILLGTILGIAFAEFEFIGQIMDPFLIAFYSLPRVALAPLITLWFGIGAASKIVLSVWSILFIALFYAYAGARSVDPDLRVAAWSMQASRRQILRYIVVPSIVPWLFVSLRVNAPYAVLGSVIGEFIISSRGIGYLVQRDASLFNTTGALTDILLLALVVVSFDQFLLRIRRRLLVWQPASSPAMRPGEVL